MRNLAALLLILSGCAYADTLDRNLLENLNYRLSRGDLDGVVPAGQVRLRAIEMDRGGDVLLHACLTDADHWERDPMIFRLLHRHAVTSISCREKSSPSMHVVFYKQDDGSRDAWVHLDLYGPGNRLGHAVEVIRNELVVGHTSQYEVYRRFLKSGNESKVPGRAYRYSSHLHEYLINTFGPQTLAEGVSAAVGHAFVDSSPKWGTGFQPYERRIEAGLARNTIRETIEFGASALLQQDESYSTSHEGTTAGRVKSALYHSFIVRGQTGDELALPRIAAIVGTTWAMQEWHPWRQKPEDPWMRASLLASSYVAKSLWHEFKPELKGEITRTTRWLK